ncbi:MAG: DUF4286 family protein [Holophagaceae bacterium]|jgi:hypothetical protein
MLIYEVTVRLQHSDEEAFRGFMVEAHIPDILSTGCFDHVSFQRLADQHFRTHYYALQQEDLDRYLTTFAPQFRKDFIQQFPGETQVERQVWQVVQTWT